MTTLEIIYTTFMWILLAIFMLYKQYKCIGDKIYDNPVYIIGLIIFTPLYFIGAIIRQVFIEDWK